MNIIESLLNENIKLSYKKKLKESPSKKVYIVTKDGKYYPMDRYKANKWLVDNGIEDFVVRPGKDSEGNPVDYFYCKEDSKLKVNESVDEFSDRVNKWARIDSYYTEDFFGDKDKVLCFSIYRNDNPNQEIDYGVSGYDLWRDYSVRPLRFEDSIGSIDNLINDIKFLKERGFRIEDLTNGNLFKTIGKRVEDI